MNTSQHPAVLAPTPDAALRALAERLFLAERALVLYAGRTNPDTVLGNAAEHAYQAWAGLYLDAAPDVTPADVEALAAQHTVNRQHPAPPIPRRDELTAQLSQMDEPAEPGDADLPLYTQTAAALHWPEATGDE